MPIVMDFFHGLNNSLEEFFIIPSIYSFYNIHMKGFGFIAAFTSYPQPIKKLAAL
jgi:hypothetical protein